MTGGARRTGGNVSFLMPFFTDDKDHTLKTKQPHTNKGVMNTYKTLDPGQGCLQDCMCSMYAQS